MKNLIGYFIGGAIVAFIGTFVYSLCKMTTVVNRINDMSDYAHEMEN